MRNGTCYKLVAVVIYFPWSGDDGHYTSYILDHGQQQWFYVDDEKVGYMITSCQYVQM